MTITAEKTFFDKKSGFMKKQVATFTLTNKKKMIAAFKKYNSNGCKIIAITHYMP